MKNQVRLCVIVGAAACAVVIVALGLAKHDVDLFAPVSLMLFIFGVLVYLLPTGLAVYKDCQSTAWIAVVNVLLGWTVLGWFAAMGWAAAGKVREPGHALGTPPAHPLPGH
jgi:Superinfection immunity protein